MRNPNGSIGRAANPQRKECKAGNDQDDNNCFLHVYCITLTVRPVSVTRYSYF